MKLLKAKPPKCPGLIISCFVIAFVMIWIYIAFFTTLLLSPKQKVFLSFAKAFGADSMIASITGFDHVKSAGNISPYPHGDFSNVTDAISSIHGATSTTCVFDLDTVNVSSFDAPDMIGGLSFHINSQLSPKDQLFHSEMYFKYMSLKTGSLELYADKNNMYLQTKTLPDRVIAVNTSTLGKDLVSSPILNSLNLSDAEKNRISNVSFDVFNNYDDISQGTFSLSALNDEYGEFFILTSSFLGSIKVTDNHLTQIVAMDNGELRCHQYSIIVSGQDLSDYISNSTDYFKDYLDIPDESVNWLYNYLENADKTKDYTFTVLLDNKCRLIEISFDDSFVMADSAPLKITGRITWSGSDYLCDNYDGSFLVNHGQEYLNIHINGTGTRCDDFCNDETTIYLDSNYLNTDIEITLDQQNDYKENSFSVTLCIKDNNRKDDYEFSISGKTNIDDKITVDLSDVSYLNNNTGTKISGSVSIEIEKYDSSIPVAEGEKLYIFSMTDTELEQLLQTIKEKAGRFSLIRILL